MSGQRSTLRSPGNNGGDAPQSQFKDEEQWDDDFDDADDSSDDEDEDDEDEDDKGDDDGLDDDDENDEDDWDEREEEVPASGQAANVSGTGNLVLGDGNSFSGSNNSFGHQNSFNTTTTNVTNNNTVSNSTTNNNIVNQGGNGGSQGGNGSAGGNKGPGRRRAMVTIVGRGGGKRRFWQAPDGAIRIKGWKPDGSPWRTKTLVSAGLARAFTPLAAICWGGKLGFKQIRLYYVGNKDNLQQMARINGGKWQRTGLGFGVAAGSRLAVGRGGGRTRVRFMSVQGGARIAVSSGNGWSLVKP
ncbi:hypothetical protein AMATHDRAFT_51255 [Amanita thiersii Skay4041]|uniref:Fucose-specific lectin n=1 Tax=Amanita thiersii Skay4041 TaxID=703135 RepID=A0A2A9NEJ8_9AGAR|nr:hypothetical protein AMATHDRAFT_51255 [Amanita thiersii Skay4041]